MVARLAPQRPEESSSDDNGYTVIGNGNSDMAANGHGPPTETTRLLPTTTTSNGSGSSASVWCGNGGYNAVPPRSNLMQVRNERTHLGISFTQTYLAFANGLDTSEQCTKQLEQLQSLR